MVVTPFPSPNPKDPEAIKRKEYGLLYSESIYSRWQSDKTLWGRASAVDGGFFDVMKSYAEGKQSLYNYQKWYRGLDRSGNLNKGYNNIDWSISSVAPKHLGTIKTVVTGSDYSLEVTSRSKEATNKKALAKHRMWYNIENNELRKAASQKLGQQIELAKYNFTPQNREELSLYEKYGGFKLPYETGLSKMIQNGFDISMWDDYIWEQCFNDLSQTSHAVTYIELNHDGSIGCKHVPIRDYVTSYTENPNLDPPYAGFFDWMTVEELAPLLKEAYPNISDDEIKMVAQKNNQYNAGNDNINWQTRDNVTDRYEYYSFRVRVFRFFFKAVETEYYEARETKEGTYIHEKQEDKKNKKPYADGRTRKTNAYKNCMIYSGIRVVGMPYVVDYGPEKNIIKAPNGEAQLPFVHVTTGEASIIERWKGWLEDHQKAILKFRTFLQQAKGDRTKYDLGILANMDFGLGKMTQAEVIRYAEETGRIMVQTRGDMLNRIDPRMAIEDLPSKDNGPLLYMQGVIGYIDAQIRSVVGITDSMAALAQTDPSKLVGVGQQEIAAGQSAMSTIAKTMARLKKQTGIKMAQKARICLEFVPKTKEYYSGVIEDQFINAVQAYKDLTLNQTGLIFRSKPSPERKALLMSLVSESLKAGKNNQVGINAGDAMMIENELENGSVEMATFYLMVSEARMQRQIDAARSQAAQENGQVATQTAQASAQAQARLDTVKSELKKSETAAQILAQLDADTALEELQNANKLQQIALQGSIDARKETNKVAA